MRASNALLLSFVVAFIVVPSRAGKRTLILQSPAVSTETNDTIAGSPLIATVPNNALNTFATLAAFRFNTFDLSRQAIISHAAFELAAPANTGSLGNCSIRIAFATANASTVLTTADRDLTARGTEVYWKPSDFGSLEVQTYATPSLRRALRAFLKQDNWNPGDSILILLGDGDDAAERSGNYRSFYTGQSGSTSPQFKIQYIELKASHPELESFRKACNWFASEAGVAFVGAAGRETAIGLKALSKKSHADLFGGPRSSKRVRQELITEFDDWCLSSKQVAVKACSMPPGSPEYSNFVIAARIMRAYAVPHHMNVLRFLGLCWDSETLMVVTEFCSRGSLQHVLRNARPSQGQDSPHLNLLDRIKMAADVARGMAYLANQEFVHRDLCARNCLVHENMTAKISGFDASTMVNQSPMDMQNGQNILNVRWMAPQVLTEARFSNKSDVWSFGVLLFECMTFASKPYADLSNGDVCHQRGFKLTRSAWGTGMSSYRIMRSCWHMGPSSRPDFEDLLSALSEELRGFQERGIQAEDFQDAGDHRLSQASSRSGSKPKLVPRPSQFIMSHSSTNVHPSLMQAQAMSRAHSKQSLVSQHGHGRSLRSAHSTHSNSTTMTAIHHGGSELADLSESPIPEQLLNKVRNKI
ncbi:uncharacterized protein MONBRDRAFT_24187 [Monosiga brevicollis MX1]|uniref:Protein kinase domain-containing protein n=1 Tax=Monosiga brevicollis TaxID=81824 RepID=A9UVN4_MONBE|nr:uncharacterized protein MONBRDRAFT_24187 [Monosiga brevicollis MX1]EDQ90614.1 predicted protein [Monosiga brevicollis MX1]|eukprot:XP_001744665.1 hypothetical protein [Monosiga brevicollis MX1]